MDFITSKEELGQIVKSHRKMRRLTQAELAEAIDLNEKQISRIEAGGNYPTLVTFFKLVKVLDIDIISIVNKSIPEINPFQEEAIAIIKNSSEKELKIYLDLLKLMKKNLKKIDLN